MAARGVGAGLPRAAGGVRGAASRAQATRSVVAMSSTFEKDWLRKDLFVLGHSFLGWVLPCSIPVGAFGGQSLNGRFLDSIGQELSHFPDPPALQDEFWVLLAIWHVGLFLILTLGQIGYQGKKQGYW